ncbi:hypothetical protein EV643_107294 [Kribbella sp. VKM Ac-2527]|uniref:Uncharacterized protein n=1 Tax=Kribbella caucasensis TaxID=2512215 RepID=A0A4R6KHP8_9ACTN|nr:hypothetical protein EV643_107294 [Kribbella sp. VKM Ac-2527]
MEPLNLMVNRKLIANTVREGAGCQAPRRAGRRAGVRAGSRRSAAAARKWWCAVIWGRGKVRR